jgi:hypothetical protein
MTPNNILEPREERARTRTSLWPLFACVVASLAWLAIREPARFLPQVRRYIEP